MFVDEDVYKAYSIDEFIEHHGVKGQKWGIRHPKLKALETFVGNHKKLVIGAAAAATLLATHHTKILKDAGVLNQKFGKTFVDGVFGGRWKTDFSLAKPGLTEEELLSKVVKPINPGFGSEGTVNNCRRCTFAYEMRRRGYNVAATKTELGTGQHGGGLYNAVRLGDDVSYRRTDTLIRTGKETLAKAKDPEAPTPFLDIVQKPFGEPIDIEHNDIFSVLSKEPDYSRGEFGMIWNTGGAHSMAYEVRNGKALIIDNQSGKIYKNMEEFQGSSSKLPPIASAGFTRLDNIQLDEPFLQRWVKNANQ